jgi:hypothetical protein
MKARFVLPLFLIFIALTDVSSACAITESGVPTCVYWTRADVVFSGKVLKVESAPKSEDLPEGSRKVRFQVLQNFKGADNPTFSLVTSRDFKLKSGETWIIYARNDIVIKSFSAIGSVKIDPKISSDELETLKSIAGGKTESTISGRTVTDFSGEAVEAVEITIEGGGKRLTAKSDANGAFSFAVPSDGTYKVELKFPYKASLKWNENLLGVSLIEGIPTFFRYEVKLNDGDCHFSFFEVSKK